MKNIIMLGAIFLVSNSSLKGEEYSQKSNQSKITSIFKNNSTPDSIAAQRQSIYQELQNLEQKIQFSSEEYTLYSAKHAIYALEFLDKKSKLLDEKISTEQDEQQKLKLIKKKIYLGEKQISYKMRLEGAYYDMKKLLQNNQKS